MKIAVIGKKNHLHWLENVYDGFSSLNCDIKLIATNKMGLYNNIARNSLKFINKDLAIKFAVDSIYKEIVSYKPDIILVLSPFLFDDNISNMIGSLKNTIKIAWIGDRFGPHHKIAANNYDLLYCTDSHFVEESKEFNFPKTKYLPLAVNEKIFYNQNLKKEDKLLFVGNPTLKRIELFNSIDTKIKLVGSKWKREINKSNIEILDKNISINDVANEYNKSKFILNIKHEQNVVNGLNMRSFEVPAVGSCLVQDYVKDLDINFDVSNEIAVYNDVNEIPEIVEKLIKDSKSTDKMIQKAYLNVHSNHLYKNRVETILNDIS